MNFKWDRVVVARWAFDIYSRLTLLMWFAFLILKLHVQHRAKFLSVRTGTAFPTRDFPAFQWENAHIFPNREVEFSIIACIGSLLLTFCVVFIFVPIKQKTVFLRGGRRQERGKKFKAQHTVKITLFPIRSTSSRLARIKKNLAMENR